MADERYVHNATGRLRRVLLCPPDYFSFQPINEITRGVLARGEQPDQAAFRREHAELVQAYRDAGVDVVLIEPDPELPYMVYARDFGACLAEGVLVGSFKEPVRQGEEVHYEAKVRALGVPVIGKVCRGSFEGGDFWLLDEATVAHGVVARTDWEGLPLRPGDPRTARLHGARDPARLAEPASRHGLQYRRSRRGRLRARSRCRTSSCVRCASAASS